MPVYEDWLKEPLKIVNNIFASDPANFDTKVQEYFENKLKSEKNYYSIPSLNDAVIHELAPNCLVRYRCMIQDSSNPEIYEQIHKFKHETNNDVMHIPSKYKDLINRPDGYNYIEQTDSTTIDDLGHNNLSQRLTFYCVPIPGESDWCKTAYKSNSFASSTCSIASTSNSNCRPGKRTIDESIDECDTNSVEIRRSPIANHSYMNENKIEEQNNETEDEASKKQRTVENDSSIKLTNTINLNFPIPNNDTNSVACMVKVYENFEMYKINDLVEFIGILSLDPSLAYCNSCISKQRLDHVQQLMDVDGVQHSFQNGIEEKCACSVLPPSLVPRIHCIKSISLKHNNPLLDNLLLFKNLPGTCDMANYWNVQATNFITNLAQSTNSPLIQSSSDIASINLANLHLIIKLRQELLSFLQNAFLLGDGLAAEYLLMNIISGTYVRKDVTILGKFTLNITNIPLINSIITQENGDKTQQKSFATVFYTYFKELLIMSHLFHLSIDNLNKSNLVPNKDYNSDKLVSGMLQLPEKFHLIIDETVLNTGELNQKGLINLHALNDISKWQKINYDFGFHAQEFPTNIRLLILSHTKSLVTSDCQLKLNTSSNTLDLEQYETNIKKTFSNNERISNFMNNVRKYLTIISNLEYKLNEPMQKIVEEDFVQMRQSNGTSDKICVEDFHMLLVIARLQALSYGKCELSLNEWNKAKCLEKERKARG